MSHPSGMLGALGASPLKRLSQNFLTSPHWVDKLTDSVASIDADEIWEIGPGLGALTGSLLKKAKAPVRLFEFDKKLAANLTKLHPEIPMELGDVLEADFENVACGRRIAVLSNLPYHLSSPILFKFLESPVRWQGFVLTFQREYGERLTAKPKSKDYGSLSVVFQWHFDCERLGIIPPGAFFPAPKIDSMALRLKLKDPEVPQDLGVVVRTAFRYRRKTLANCFRGIVPRDDLAKALEPLGFSVQARPEEIAPDQYLTLARTLAPWFPKLSGSGNQEPA